MPDYVLKTDVIPLEGVIEREFEGKAPTRLLKEVPGKMKQLFKISSSSFFEDKIKWDKLGDPVEFFGQWRGKVGKDARTTFWLKVIVQGKQDMKEKKGSATVVINAWLETKIPYGTAVDRVFKEINMKMFYEKHLRTYVAEMMAMVERFDLEIKDVFEVGTKEEM